MGYKARRIGVFGAGYVGLVTAACCAHLGHDVAVFEADALKRRSLAEGTVPFYEPGLRDVVARTMAAGGLRFVDVAARAAASRDVVFVAVGTPSAGDGACDLRALRSVVAEASPHLDAGAVLALKSTVPVGTGSEVARAASRAAGRAVTVAANPEFLREGSAVYDFLHPDRIVLGVEPSEGAGDGGEAALRAVYAPLDAPVIVTSRAAAELTKVAANAMLAARLAMVHELAALCDALGLESRALLATVGLDVRIGTRYLEPGLGFGGSCLPKDLRMLERASHRAGIEPIMAAATRRANATVVDRAASRLEAALDGVARTRIAVWGLAFKPHTDDTRESPAVRLTTSLAARGADVRVHDPAARWVPPGGEAMSLRVTQRPTALDAARGADAVVVATAWPDYAAVDLAAVRAVVRRPVVVDPHRLLPRDAWERAGFAWDGVVSEARAASA